MPVAFTIENPLALVLFLTLPFLFVLAFKSSRRKFRGLSLLIRTTIVTLLILSLANLQPIIQSNRLATVFLVDVSDSMGETGQAQALQFTRLALSNLRTEQQAGVILFGQEARIAKTLASTPELPATATLAKPTSGYTNIAEAVRLGLALLPANQPGRLVIVSDGNQNLDEVRNAATQAKLRGVPVDVVNIGRQETPDISVSSLQLPATLRQGEEFSLKIGVDSNYEGRAQLLIFENEKVISTRQVDLVKGSNLFQETLIAKEAGAARYRAQVLSPQDSLQQNNLSEASALVKSKAHVLLVEGHPEQSEAANLQAALQQTEIESTLIAPDKFPALTELAPYDSVIMVNVPGNLLTATAMQDLQTFVKEQGKGLVVVGGEESYGLGGYFRTPLEEMLPVNLQLPQKREMPTVAMVLVVDRSASMTENYRGSSSYGGRTKLEIAKDATYLAVQQLSSNDQVGVLVFDTESKWIIPLQQVGDVAKLEGPISRIGSGGGTFIFSGFTAALEALKPAKATNKHIIILTDGQDLGRANYDRLLADANTYNITVSTVGLGRDVNQDFLTGLAERGGGRFNYVSDPDNLPKIFAKEARLAARSYIVEESFVPSAADSSAITKNIKEMPSLQGYVVTQAKPNSTVPLITQRKEPLLAHWQYGLGRVAAWTSDAKGRWAADWLGWADFPRFWSQVARWTMPETPPGGLQVQTRNVGNRIYVSADAFSDSSQYLNGLNVTAKVAGATGEEIVNLRLTQIAPGRYEGYFVPKNNGTFVVNVEGMASRPSVGGAGPNLPQNLRQSVTAVANYSPEFRQFGTNDRLLAEIAAQTGGRVIKDPLQVFQTEFGRSSQPVEIWQWLLLLAVLLFPLDIAVRTSTSFFRRWQKRSVAAANAPFRPALSPTPLVAPPPTPALANEPEPAQTTLDEATLASYLERLTEIPSENNPESPETSPDFRQTL